ncbi:MAG: DNA primase DnaG [Candidatus Micrarchaeota archaeon]|nr:DNA primase DnaG [Candidatus Micrarchaeota archaeon]
MGKTYIDTVKYLVYANLEIDGLVEKPDVVGAIFGQTEGLLGDELDLRDLQKNGRIGRIEVDLNPRGGRSVGKIKLPSSLDMVETCILAAALETVDRVGPCEAKIGIEKVEDTRNAKRKILVDRAKTLLKSMLMHEIPESKEISEMVRQEVKVAEISEYGPEKLPCGPGIEKMDSIVIVEGRADVLNLLKNDVQNVVAVGGANVTNAIAKLAREKEVTVFLDGDRGGDIILNELARVADIDFVARAPVGKEVEELSRKELIKCLRAKVPYETSQPISQVGEDRKDKYPTYGRERDRNNRGGRYDDRHRQRRDDRQDVMPPLPEPPVQQQAAPVEMAKPDLAPPAPMQEQPVAAQVASAAPVAQKPAAVPPALLASLDELENTLRARFYNAELAPTKEMPVREMMKALEDERDIYSIVFDGIITQRLADLSENKKIGILVGIKLGNVFRKPASVLIHTKT